MNGGVAKATLWLEIKNKVAGGIQKAKQYVNDNVREMKGRLSELKSSSISSFSSIKEFAGGIPGLGSLVGMATNPITIMTAAVLALGGAYMKASAMAREFENSMAKANVTAQESPDQFKKTKSDVLNIAAKSEVANATQVAPEAFNILLSSGMEKDTVMATLKPTLDAAKAGFTDVGVVAKAAANAMNSSGITDANRLYDILFATLNKGNAEFQDIAQYLPKIIPTAKNVGFNLEQVAGAFAYLTAQGQTAERSATLLENAFKVLGDPEKAKSFRAIGVEFFDAQGKMKPLADIIDKVNVALTGLTDQQKTKILDSLGLDMEAAGAFAAMAQDANKLRETIDFTTNSQGELNNALEFSKTSSDAWIKMGNQMDAMWISVGTKVNEALAPIGEFLAPIAEQILPVIGELFTWIWDVLSSIWQPIGTALKGLMEWYSQSELIRDIVSLIGLAFQGLGIVIGWIGDGLSWVWEHTLKPILDGIEWVYKKAKSLLGLSSEKVEVKGEVKVETPAKDLKQTPDVPQGKPNALVSKKLQEIDKKDKQKEEKGALKGAEQVRNITVTIGNIIGGDFITQNQQFSQMSPAEFQRYISELLMRYTKGLETGMQ